MLKDIAEEMSNNVTEIFVTITKVVKNLMPLITLAKPTVFAFLYYSSMPKSFTSYKSIPICTHQSSLAQTLIVKVLQNITANVCKSLANKQIHDDLLQK